MSKLSTKQFLYRVLTRVGPTEYNYSLVDYVNAKTNISIICPKHGVFYQTPDNHLQGKGCVKCSRPIQNEEDFKKLAPSIHNGKYSYDRTVYTKSNNKIEIICPDHGSFFQTPNSHLSKTKPKGCPHCTRNFNYDTAGFIERAVLIHKEYDYSRVDYKNQKTKVEILCRSHGPFWQRPDNHLTGNGCPICYSGISRKEEKWLNSIGLPNDSVHRQVRLIVDEQTYCVDGFDPICNKVFHFHGDYWHGNPRVHNSSSINIKNGISFGSLYERTLIRDNALRKAGYDVIVMWEMDYDALS